MRKATAGNREAQEANLPLLLEGADVSLDVVVRIFAKMSGFEDVMGRKVTVAQDTQICEASFKLEREGKIFLIRTPKS